MNNSINETSIQIESLKEQIHKLTAKLNSRQRLEVDYEEDLQNLERKHVAIAQRKCEEIEHLNKIVVDLKYKYDVLETKCSTLIEENNCFKLKFNEKSQDSTIAKANHSLMNDLQATNQKLESVECENASLKASFQAESSDLKSKLSAACKDSSIWQSKFVELNERYIETETLLIEARQCLKETETDLSEIKMELGVLKMKPNLANAGHSTKGNSMFAEVNDRREQVEDYAKKLKSQYASLKEEVVALRKDNSNLKYQIAKAFQIASANESATNEIRLLEEALALKSNELKVALKLNCRNIDASVESNDDLVHFYKSQADGLKVEMDKEKLDRYASEAKTLEVQRKLCNANTELNRLRSELILLQSKANENESSSAKRPVEHDGIVPAKIFCRRNAINDEISNVKNGDDFSFTMTTANSVGLQGPVQEIGGVLTISKPIVDASLTKSEHSEGAGNEIVCRASEFCKENDATNDSDKVGDTKVDVSVANTFRARGRKLNNTVIKVNFNANS